MTESRLPPDRLLPEKGASVPGFEGLPLYVQVVIWLLLCLLGILWASNKFWVQRHIENYDKGMESLKSAVSQAAQAVSKTAEDLGKESLTAKTELLSFRKEMSTVHEEFRRENHAIRNELSQTLIRTITLRESMDKLDAKASGLAENVTRDKAAIEELRHKIQTFDENQRKLFTIVTKVSERFVKVSHKQDES